MKIDIKQYQILQEIYDYFNAELFDNQLPEIIFTIDYRKSQANGFFHYEKMQKGDKKISIISLNPDTFNRENIKIISTLVHEMVHAWECYQVKIPAKAYHTKTWSNKMISIGLMPSSDGTETGKKTGRHMTHYIIPGGLFECKAKEFISKHNDIFLFSGIADIRHKITANRNKIKYTCSCGCNMWGGSELEATCKKCNTDFTSYE